MPNDMRDKIAEIIRNARMFADPLSQVGYAEADALIANGVILPPCKVVDKVYLIPTYNGKAYCGVVEDKVQMIGITSRGVHIKARNHHDHNKMHMLGKTVFLTKEDAEKALKERGGDNNDN